MRKPFGKGRKILVSVICAAITVAGLIAAVPASAIVNGEPAPLGASDFVAQVTVQRDGDGDGNYDFGGSCTGTLIHPMWVLTAAHCFDDYPPGDPFVRTIVRVGNQQRNVGIERRSAVSVRLHPSYYGKWHNDVALLRLDRPSYMRTIKLATPTYRARWTTDPATDAVYGIATGWGKMLGGTQASIIQRVLVRLAAATFDSGNVLQINLDTAANNGKGTCKGDSGGPLLVRADGDELRQVGVLRGGYTDPCPGGEDYSEVGAGPNRDWIRSQIPDIDNPAHPSALEPWNYRGAPVAGGGCGTTGCQTYTRFDYAPAVASFNDVQRSFVVTNGTIYSRTRYGESWTGWSALPDGYTTAKVAAVMHGPDAVDLFARGGDNALYRKEMRSGVWQNGWQYLGGTLKSGPAAVREPNGSVHVFVRGIDDTVWEWTPAKGWRGRGGRITSEIGAAHFSGTRVDVFARGTDNRLHQLVVDGDGAWWYVLDGVLTSGPAVASRGKGLLDVYVKGTDNALWHKAWDGFRWTAWDYRGGGLTADPAAALGRDEAVDVYVRGTDSALWQKPT